MFTVLNNNQTTWIQKLSERIQKTINVVLQSVINAKYKFQSALFDTKKNY